MKKQQISEIIAIVIVCLCLPILGMSFHLAADFKTQLTDLASFGSWVGGVTAPFFGLASTYLLYITLKRQREDSNQNQVEMAMQRFENTLFQFISLHNQNVVTIQQTWKNERTGAKDFFHDLRDRMGKKGRKEAEIQGGYEEEYEAFYHYIEHFYDHVILVLCFINEAKGLEAAERRRYHQLFLSQLSTDEMFLVFYHSHYKRLENRGLLRFSLDFVIRIKPVLLREEHLSHLN